MNLEVTGVGKRTVYLLVLRAQPTENTGVRIPCAGACFLRARLTPWCGRRGAGKDAEARVWLLWRALKRDAQAPQREPLFATALQSLGI
jgi:hypothetical protein